MRWRVGARHDRAKIDERLPRRFAPRNDRTDGCHCGLDPQSTAPSMRWRVGARHDRAKIDERLPRRFAPRNDNNIMVRFIPLPPFSLVLQL